MLLTQPAQITYKELYEQKQISVTNLNDVQINKNVCSTADYWYFNGSLLESCK